MAVICEDCKTPNLDGMRFCDQCSAPLPPSQPGLGAPVPNNPNFAAPATPFYQAQTYYPSPQQASYGGPQPLQPQPMPPSRPITPTPPLYRPSAPGSFNPSQTPFMPPTAQAQQSSSPQPVSSPKSEQPRLTVTNGAIIYQEFKLNPGLNEIGRWDEDENYYPHIDLTNQDTDGYVHRRHAFIRYKVGGWWLEDTGGANGTKIRRDGQIKRLPAGGIIKLQPCDEIIIGRVFLLFETAL